MLISLSIFRCGNEKSVQGRPSWELAPYECTSQIAEDFASWCKLVSKECRFSERAESAEWFTFQRNFFSLSWTRLRHFPLGYGVDLAIKFFLF